MTWLVFVYSWMKEWILEVVQCVLWPNTSNCICCELDCVSVCILSQVYRKSSFIFLSVLYSTIQYSTFPRKLNLVCIPKESVSKCISLVVHQRILRVDIKERYYVNARFRNFFVAAFASQQKICVCSPVVQFFTNKS